MPMMAVCVAVYLDKMFPKILSHWLRGCFAALSALFAGFILWTEPRFSTWLSVYYRALAGAVLAVFFIMFLAKLRKPTADQYVSLYGIIVLFWGVLNDILLHHNFFRLQAYSANLTPLVMLIFMLSQLVSLYLGNHRITEEAREAEQQSAADNADLSRMNSMKTEFLSNVSHELKTPLTVISVNVQTVTNILEELSIRDEAAGELLKSAQSEIMRLTRMVSGMLTLASMSESADGDTAQSGFLVIPRFTEKGR
ncbi:hypothetical protein FACS1894191_2470 [Clostridia bacterium]|nr:hypothetical protein FACS1894191_2470 [Clostridia bacterium]